jgi:hypothetical protein
MLFRFAFFNDLPGPANVLDPTEFDSKFSSIAEALARFASLKTVHMHFAIPDGRIKPINWTYM